MVIHPSAPVTALGDPTGSSTARHAVPSPPPRCWPIAALLGSHGVAGPSCRCWPVMPLLARHAVAGPSRRCCPVTPFLVRLGVPRPDQLLEAVALDMLAIGQADRPESLRGQPFVDLVEVLAY